MKLDLSLYCRYFASLICLTSLKLSFLIFFFFVYFLKGNLQKEGRVRDIFHTLVHCPNDYNC